MKSHEVLTLIEEITRNDGSHYYEVANMVQNGRAELAAVRGFIKEVRILQLNIPRSTNVIKYEEYINNTFTMQDEGMTYFQEWEKTLEAQALVNKILRENHIA